MVQAGSSKSQQNSLQQSPAKADLPATASKKPSTKSKELAMLEADSLATEKQLPRLRRATHTDTDTKLEKKEGQRQQAGPSHAAASQSVQQQKQQQRRSQRQPTTKAQGGQHALDPPAAGGVHVKPPSKQNVKTSLTATKAKGNRTGPTGGSPEQKAGGSKQVAGALKNGKKTTGSRWEPAELEVPFGPSAEGKKAVGSKGKPKGSLVHSVSKGKALVGTKQRTSRVTQSPAQEAKPVVIAKEEPAKSLVQDDSNVQQLSNGPVDLPLGLGKGKRKRTATKPLYVDEDSQDEEEEQGGSKHHSMGGKLEEERVYRYACTGGCNSLCS